jgi:hypothetical protein
VATTDGAFILLAPSTQLIPAAAEDLLKRKNAMFLPLADVIDVVDGGSFKAVPRCEDLFAEFRSRSVPQADAAPSMVFFPTLADAEWKNVTIRFVDGHTVSVKVKDQTGTLTWGSSGADRRNQKRRENLADDLRAFFRLDGDPFEYVEDVKGWRARFTVMPES